MNTPSPAVSQSMAGIVREHLPEIEMKIQNGTSVAYLHYALITSKGVGGNLLSFRKAITRERRKEAKRGTDGAVPLRETPVTPQAVHSTVAPATAQKSPAAAQGLDKYFTRKSMFDKRD